MVVVVLKFLKYFSASSFIHYHSKHIYWKQLQFSLLWTVFIWIWMDGEELWRSHRIDTIGLRNYCIFALHFVEMNFIENFQCATKSGQSTHNYQDDDDDDDSTNVMLLIFAGCSIYLYIFRRRSSNRSFGLLMTCDILWIILVALWSLQCNKKHFIVNWK
jgi:hypothetical protein